MIINTKYFIVYTILIFLLDCLHQHSYGILEIRKQKTISSFHRTMDTEMQLQGNGFFIKDEHGVNPCARNKVYLILKLYIAVNTSGTLNK
jgi:hypothetical protein